jgi:hypothetical protein
MDTFRFASDPTGDLGIALAGPQFSDDEIVVAEDAVTVRLGTPPAFSARIPRDAIATAERRPPLRGRTRGIHGRRGRWLVNRSAENLVRLRIDPAVPARIKLIPEMVEGAKLPKGRLGKALLRRFTDREISLRELTVSVDRPDDFLASLRAR